MKRTLNWFTGGGFKYDPSLTKADKKYYAKRLASFPEADKKRWREIDKCFDKEHRRVEEMIKRKDNKALGRWLSFFGKSEKSLWSPDDFNKFDKGAWNR